MACSQHSEGKDCCAFLSAKFRHIFENIDIALMSLVDELHNHGMQFNIYWLWNDMQAVKERNHLMPALQSDAKTLRSDIKISAALLLCGGVNAVNIAKLATVVPVLRVEFGLSLSQMGLLASLFSVLILLTGVIIAGFVRIIGAKRIILTALSVSACGTIISLAGSNYAALLTGRVIEGISLITVMLTAPALLAAHTSLKRRGIIMGVWGGFMPFGNAAVFLSAPILVAIGSWQAVWIAGLLSTLLVGVMTYLIVPPDIISGKSVFDRKLIIQAIKLPILSLLGLSFAAHSLTYQSLLQFMPVFSRELGGLSLGFASSIAALFCILNFCGNVFSGQMLQKGRAPSVIGIATGCLSALCLAALSYFSGSILIFIPMLMLMGFLIGWLPPVCFYMVGKQTADPAHMPVYNAWMFQIQAIGMLCGPLLIGNIVENTQDWSLGIKSLIPFCILISIFCFSFRGLKKTP